jgi:hypothetical protein
LPNSKIDWDDPAARAALIERVGIEQYNALFEEHVQQSTVSTVAGHAIRPIVSVQSGRIFMVGDTCTGFPTLAEAEAFARKHPRETERGLTIKWAGNRSPHRLSRQSSARFHNPSTQQQLRTPTASDGGSRRRLPVPKPTTMEMLMTFINGPPSAQRALISAARCARIADLEASIEQAGERQAIRRLPPMLQANRSLWPRPVWRTFVREAERQAAALQPELRHLRRAA